MARDEEEFTMIFHETYTGLCRFLECLFDGNSVAQEIAQESFLRFYRLEDNAVSAAEARFWLYRVARNLALNEINRGRVRQKFLGQLAALFHTKEADPFEKLEQDERREKVLGLLRAIPEQQRAALLLREQEEMSYREIARVLGVTESKVKVDIFRARCALRDLWREAEERASRLR
jgi:RNA polymerase sigma-70 factor, ECF subfamily